MLMLPTTTTTSVAQVLRDLGVGLDVQSKSGRTAAMTASSKSHVESVKLLHEMKADLNVRDEDGWTVIHYAANGGNTEMLKVMSRQHNVEQ